MDRGLLRRRSCRLPGRLGAAADEGAADADRVFETIWSVEPPVVWDAARVSAGIATAKRPGLVDRVRSRLEIDPGRPAEDQLRLAAAITNRTLSYLS